jgi:hypothetical protein
VCVLGREVPVESAGGEVMRWASGGCRCLDGLSSARGGAGRPSSWVVWVTITVWRANGLIVSTCVRASIRALAEWFAEISVIYKDIKLYDVSWR